MSDAFSYDVFLSHSSRDKAVVRPLAQRLRGDGLRVWFDESEDPAKVEEALERSRVLVLCISESAFGRAWAKLEPGTFRFRDPRNKERRFVPLRLDKSPVRGSLARFQCINWRGVDREREYAKLFAACRLAAEEDAARKQVARKVVQLNYKWPVDAYAFSPDGTRALTAGSDSTVRLWDTETGRCLSVLEGHRGPVMTVASNADQSRTLSGSHDNTARLWDVEARHCLRVFEGHTNWVWSVAWSPDERRSLSCSTDRTVRMWDMETGLACGCSKATPRT